MTTQVVTTRRGFGKMLFVGVGGYLGLSLMGKLAMDVGSGVEVDTTGPHAWVKHGPSEVQTVHDVMKAKAASDATWFNRPPCKDNRYRFTLRLASGDWAVWVLEQVAQNAYREVTAFVTSSQSYVKTMREECGDDSWGGHAYAG